MFFNAVLLAASTLCAEPAIKAKKTDGARPADVAAAVVDDKANLTTNEWSGISYVQSVDPLYHCYLRMVSLRPGKEWDSGVIWFLVHYDSCKGIDKVSGEELFDIYSAAYKGTYQFFKHPKDSDVIVLKANLLKRYDGSHSQIPYVTDRWSANTRWDALAVELLITLDNGSFPMDELEVSVGRRYFVDEDGRETVARHEPDTIAEKIAGRGAVKRVPKVNFADEGETFTLVKGDAMSGHCWRRDVGAAPPTFKSRDKQISLKPDALRTTVLERLIKEE